MSDEPARVEVRRGGIIESQHRVHVVVVDGAGNLVQHQGDPTLLTYPRSALKPFQALALITSGAAEAYGVTDAELAIASGSHAGEPSHVDAVRQLLKRGGHDESALQCGTHGPRTTAARAAWAGRGQPIHHNCSGKHAAMLLLQKHLGGKADNYLDPQSPAQQTIRTLLANLIGIDADKLDAATDGCGAPTYAMTLAQAARLYAHLGMPQNLATDLADGLKRLGKTMRWHAHLVAGAGLLDTDLIDNGEDRLVCKSGAEGFEAAADFASGMGLAIKVEDGALRAVAPMTVEALRQLSWLESRAFEALGEWWLPAVTNHAGTAVGDVRARLDLS